MGALKLAYISYNPLLTKGGCCPTLATDSGISKVEGGGSLEKHPQYFTERKEGKGEEGGGVEEDGEQHEKGSRKRVKKKIKKETPDLVPKPWVI